VQVRVIEIDPREILLLDKNARYMRHETFAQLKNNVQGDGALTSVPFCVHPKEGDERWLVISGNHRVKAAIAAALMKIFVLVTDEILTADQMKAIQLSHNSLAGEDDPMVLKEIYESIEGSSLKEYAGLDDKVLGLIKELNAEPLPAVSLEWTTVQFLFLPEEAERLKELIGKAAKAAGGRYAARFKDYDRFMEMVSIAGDAHGVVNAATSINMMLDVFERHLDDLESGYVDEQWKPKAHIDVPAAAALGQYLIPMDTAVLLRRVLQNADPKRKYAALNAALRAHLEQAAVAI
jgi:ParB-like nuclease domain